MKCKKCGNENEGNICEVCGLKIVSDGLKEEKFNTAELVLKFLENDKDMRNAFLIGLTLIIAVTIVVIVLYYYSYSSMPTILKIL